MIVFIFVLTLHLPDSPTNASEVKERFLIIAFDGKYLLAYSLTFLYCFGMFCIVLNISPCSLVRMTKEV